MPKNNHYWQQLIITNITSSNTTIDHWLKLIGADAITVSPDQQQIKALFKPNYDLGKIQQFLSAHSHESNSHESNSHELMQFSSNIIQQDDWQRTQQQDQTPVIVNDQLSIVPVNMALDYNLNTESENANGDKSSNNNKKNHQLYIDAITAFGSGKHPTTLQCLRWLSSQNLSGINCMDFGCGSGILAITALAQGANHAWAIDIDPKALSSTKKNAILNQINLEQLTIATQLKQQPKADLILANLLLNPLCELADYFYQQLGNKGQLILAGVLNEQSEQLSKCYNKRFIIRQINELDDWPVFLAQKQ